MSSGALAVARGGTIGKAEGSPGGAEDEQSGDGDREDGEPQRLDELVAAAPQWQQRWHEDDHQQAPPPSRRAPAAPRRACRCAGLDRRPGQSLGRSALEEPPDAHGEQRTNGYGEGHRLGSRQAGCDHLLPSLLHNG